MKKLLIPGLLCLLLAACNQSPDNSNNNTEMAAVNEAQVNVYYFYGRQRCVTCITLQEVAKDAIMSNFEGNQDVAFHEIDFSQRENGALADKYEIVFSSLIIANNEAHKDLTDEAFAMVMSNPEGLKSLIINETNQFLN
jgi:hypothetical protein